MKYTIHDKKYRFRYYFDSATGFYLRTGVLDEKGRDTGKDPFMGSFPHLIDVGIMGHCAHGESGLCRAAGVQCYQSGFSVKQPDMSAEDFERIARECRHRTNQLALGGRGDPNLHRDFERILRICQENDLVPNYTTSGFGLTDEQVRLTREYCGAVAVSWYRSDYTKDAIARFSKAGCVTNIHYVLSRSTLPEAVERLRGGGFPDSVNAVIFLTHKPVGQGENSETLTEDTPGLADFCELVNHQHYPFKVGFDACAMPLILNRCPDLAKITLDTCEGARFSCYISARMVMTPCSFDQEERFGVSLRGKTIEQAWNSPEFERFRGSLRGSCPGCEDRELCMGGCPLLPQIALCARAEKAQRAAV